MMFASTFRSATRSTSLRTTALSRCISTSRVCRNEAAIPTPWFVEERPKAHFETPASLRIKLAPPIPTTTPELLKELHAQLLHSPHLDVKHLVVTNAVTPPSGPELPDRLPQGRRGRGGTFAGESMYDATNGLWNWIVFAQVKEGTEGRGAIDSVVRVVRKVLLDRTPPVTLPPKSRRQMQNGWAMIDAGNFAVHILSKEAREKYFSDIINPQLQ
ncbi:hypothetical protein BKA70DRAFT_1554667 [Coprinopsis sp. MPI-PUGE-AT-0042]|nr:hypothetical protein BKA70DRAFT_1554667 [Coprinopsis sp. MPI-PUGE-AT-0042]